MREALRQIKGTRARWRGTFDRFGHRTSGGYVKPMALLLNVTDDRDRPMCDHVWLNRTLLVDRLDLQPGDRIEFTARVTPYEKGYHDNRRLDYRLSNPTQFVKLGQMPPHDTKGNGLLFPDAFKETK